MIRFRAVAKRGRDAGEYVHGYYVKCRGTHYILEETNETGYDERDGKWIEIEPDTLDQLVGSSNICDVYRPMRCK